MVTQKLITIALSTAALYTAPVFAQCSGSDYTISSKIERVWVYNNGAVNITTENDTTSLNCDCDASNASSKPLRFDNSSAAADTLFATLMAAETMNLTIKIDIDGNGGNGACQITSVETLDFN